MTSKNKQVNSSINSAILIASTPLSQEELEKIQEMFDPYYPGLINWMLKTQKKIERNFVWSFVPKEQV